MKLLYVQYAGDFSEAYHRIIVTGGEENFYGQKYSVETVVEQARRGIDVEVIVLRAAKHRKVLETRLSSVGMGEVGDYRKSACKEIDRLKPDLAILRTPDPIILQHLNKLGTKVLPTFADSFDASVGLRGRWFRWLLARELRKKSLRWVCNHQINASRSLVRIGVDPRKIVPYDWEHNDNPSNWNKTVPPDIEEKRIDLFFAGSIVETKGVFDLIRSLAHVRKQGRSVKLTIAGRGSGEAVMKAALEAGVRDLVNFLGLISHGEVCRRMFESDLVVVPSHHAYPEGLPMTIMESLMVGTPVVATDHPMFMGLVGINGSVRFVPERQPERLASMIFDMLSERDRYVDMVSSAKLDWESLVLKNKWAEIVNSWIANPSGVDFSGASLVNIR